MIRTLTRHKRDWLTSLQNGEVACEEENTTRTNFGNYDIVYHVAYRYLRVDYLREFVVNNLITADGRPDRPDTTLYLKTTEKGLRAAKKGYYDI